MNLKMGSRSLGTEPGGTGTPTPPVMGLIWSHC